MVNRIAVVGGSGAGKTMLSRALGAATGLPVVHVDRYYFEPDWKRRTQESVSAELTEIAVQPEWIIDGTDIRTLETRIFRADLIVYLHVATRVRAWRVIKRMFMSYRKTRVDLPSGCKGRLSIAHVKWAVFGYGRVAEPKLKQLLTKVDRHVPIIHIRNKKDHDTLRSLFPGYGPIGDPKEKKPVLVENSGS